MIAALLLGTFLHGVIDQVDAGWALVEWEGHAWGYVPSELLPTDVGEGDRIILKVRRRRGHLVELPLEVAPDGESWVRASIHQTRAQRARHRRSHERDH
jgi:hypothetical protein